MAGSDRCILKSLLISSNLIVRRGSVLRSLFAPGLVLGLMRGGRMRAEEQGWSRNKPDRFAFVTGYDESLIGSVSNWVLREKLRLGDRKNAVSQRSPLAQQVSPFGTPANKSVPILLQPFPNGSAE